MNIRLEVGCSKVWTWKNAQDVAAPPCSKVMVTSAHSRVGRE
jgi:hypothetical protein